MSLNNPGDTDVRAQIDRLVESGSWAEAIVELRRLWRHGRNAATGSFVSDRFGQIAGCPGKSPIIFVSHKVAVLRSFSVEPLVPLLKAEAWAHGLAADVYISEFNAWAQEAVNARSALYRFAPDTVIVAVETRSISPALWGDNQDGSPSAPDWMALAQEAAGRIVQVVDALQRNCRANIVIHNFAQPDWPADGAIDCRHKGGQAAAIAWINQFLPDLAAARTGVYVLDYDGLTARFGRRSWYDETRWQRVRLPIATACLPQLIDAWMRYLCPLAGRIAKVCAVDLDNTLWGGVIGEDGMEGIRLSTEYPGAAYLHVQQALIELERRGILLAVVSKNNPQDALQALDQHPSMLLRSGRFSALRIDWTEKSANIRAVAEELNLGLDSIAFVDDNPVERQQVEQSLPGITVIDMGDDPSAFAAILRETPEFSRLTLSEEDRQRPALYAAQRQTAELRESAKSVEEFLASLHQSIEVASVGPLTIGRAAQMTQKTNQFNLTTRRYTEQQLAEMSLTPDWGIYIARVRDRFADNGLVALAILRLGARECEIDTFLLSCRVISRGVEQAFLHALIAKLDGRQIERLYGWFIPTRKNAPCRDFYSASGFSLREETPDGKQCWEIAIGRGNSVPLPAYIQLFESSVEETRQPQPVA